MRWEEAQSPIVLCEVSETNAGDKPSVRPIMNLKKAPISHTIDFACTGKTHLHHRTTPVRMTFEASLKGGVKTGEG